MAKKTRGGRNTKKAIVGLFIIIVLAAIIALGVYQNKPQAKKSAAEYFEILDPSLTDREYLEPSIADGGGPETSNVLIVYGISFKLKAIGGDAHNVIVDSWGEAEPVNFDEMRKNQYESVEQTSPRPLGVRIEREEGKFPFPLRIFSSEAEGEIIINF